MFAVGSLHTADLATGNPEQQNIASFQLQSHLKGGCGFAVLDFMLSLPLLELDARQARQRRGNLIAVLTGHELCQPTCKAL